MKSISSYKTTFQPSIGHRAFDFGRLLAAIFTISTAGVAFCWTTPTAVDVNSATAVRFDTTLSAAAGAGDTRGVVWASDGQTTDNLNGVFFSRSVNGGATWSPRTDVIDTLSLPLGSWGERPCLATDAGNTWLIAWDACKVSGKTIEGDRDMYFIRSTDGGLNWSTSGTLNSNAADPNHRNYNITLATNKTGSWCSSWVTYVHVTPLSVPSQHVTVARSSDNALTWSAVQFLDDETSNTYNQNPHIATDGTGTWIVAWDSSNTTDTDVRYCRSTDNGMTWSAGSWLNSTATIDNSVVGNYDGQVRLAANPSGVWVAVWTSSYDATTAIPVKDRVVFARSLNNGVTWSVPTPVDASIPSNAPMEQAPDIVWSGTTFAILWSGLSGLEAGYSSDGASWSSPVAVAASSGFAGGPESRPRLAAGTTGLRLGAWIRRPAGATGPDIIASQDSSDARVVDWNLWW